MHPELPRVVAARHLGKLGFSRGRLRTELRRGRWQRLAPGLYLTASDGPTRLDWAAAGIALAPVPAAVSGWDAARLHGAGSPHPGHRPVLVLSRTGRNRIIGEVRMRRTSRPFSVTLLPAEAGPAAYLPIVSCARAVIDAAIEMDNRDAVMSLLASAVQGGRCSLADLLTELRTAPRGGTAILNRVVQDLRAGAHSAAEAQVLHLLRRSGLPPFEMNVAVVNPLGERLYVLDIVWRSLRAALEIDSRQFHFSADDWQRTLARHNTLTRLGFSVAHYPPRRIATAPQSFIREVDEWLRGRAAEIGVAIPTGSTTRLLGRDPKPIVVPHAQP